MDVLAQCVQVCVDTKSLLRDTNNQAHIGNTAVTECYNNINSYRRASQC